MIWCWKNAANKRGEIGIGNEFLKIAPRAGDMLYSSHILLIRGIP